MRDALTQVCVRADDERRAPAKTGQPFLAPCDSEKGQRNQVG